MFALVSALAFGTRMQKLKPMAQSIGKLRRRATSMFFNSNDTNDVESPEVCIAVEEIPDPEQDENANVSEPTMTYGSGDGADKTQQHGIGMLSRAGKKPVSGPSEKTSANESRPEDFSTEGQARIAGSSGHNEQKEGIEMSELRSSNNDAVHSLNEGDWLLPPDDSGSEDTTSYASDLPMAPLSSVEHTTELPSTAAPVSAHSEIPEDTTQRRTLKAPSMAAPTLDVSSLHGVPKDDELPEKGHESSEDHDVETCGDDLEPEVSSGHLDCADGANENNLEQPSVAWDDESAQATQQLIDRIDMMSADLHETPASLGLGEAPAPPLPETSVPSQRVRFSIELTEDGDQYFVNILTQETMWDLPDDGDVVEI
jgi:hypothetical protein